MIFSSSNSIESNNCPSSRTRPHGCTCLPPSTCDANSVTTTAHGRRRKRCWVVSQVMCFHFRFQHCNLINLIISDQTRQGRRDWSTSAREFREATGMSGGSWDGRRRIRRTGSVGVECARVSDDTFSRLFVILIFSFSIFYL